MDRLRSAWNKIRAGNLSGFSNGIRRNFLSEETMWLFVKKCDVCRNTHTAEGDGIGYREASYEDIDAIAAAWPSEFSFMASGSQPLCNMLSDRFNNDISCFIAYKGRQVIGATWCSPWKYERAMPDELQGQPAYEETNTFTIKKARGKGIAGKLKLIAMHYMVERERKLVFSLVKFERVASIRVNEKLGFRKLGLLTTGVRFGRRFCRLDQAAFLNEPYQAGINKK